jgi:hypothetical protein
MSVPPQQDTGPVISRLQNKAITVAGQIVPPEPGMPEGQKTPYFLGLGVTEVYVTVLAPGAAGSTPGAMET